MQEMAKKGLKPVNKSVMMLNLVLIAILFSRNVTYVLKELETKHELRNFQELVMFSLLKICLVI